MSLMLLKPQTIISQPETAKDTSVTLECPRCYWLFEVTQPDSKHPKPTYNKNEIWLFNGDFFEQPRVCRNPKCKKHFTIYWYNST